MTPAAMRAIALLAIFALHQVDGECKNCVKLEREQEAMFRAHSQTCLAEAGPAAATALAAALRSGSGGGAAAHRYALCVLQRCKMLGKDGKILVASAMRKMTHGKPATNKLAKELERCVEQAQGETPEERAWALFRCGWQQKGLLGDIFAHLIPADA